MAKTITRFSVTLYTNASLSDEESEEEYEEVEAMINDLRKWLLSNVPATTSKININHEGYPIVITLDD